MVNDYIPYLIEFRKRAIRSSSIIFLIFLLLFWQDHFLYSLIAHPILSLLPNGSHLIATEITATFTVPMKLAFIVAILIAIPYLMYELWSFVSPALYKKEKYGVLPFFCASLFLFYLGCAFSFFFICPIALQFFTSQSPKDVMIMADIRHYLDFILTLVLGGGFAFQVPIITILCIKTNIVTAETFAHFRPYIIVIAFILGMLLTPPDVISQILLALPMWGLFEIGLWVGRRLGVYG